MKLIKITFQGKSTAVPMTITTTTSTTTTPTPKTTITQATTSKFPPGNINTCFLILFINK